LAELTVVLKLNHGVPAMAVHHCRGLSCLPAGRFVSFLDKQKRKERNAL